jgi:hypothetical protein
MHHGSQGLPSDPVVLHALLPFADAPPLFHGVSAEHARAVPPGAGRHASGAVLQ